MSLRLHFVKMVVGVDVRDDGTFDVRLHVQDRSAKSRAERHRATATQRYSKPLMIVCAILFVASLIGAILTNDYTRRGVLSACVVVFATASTILYRQSTRQVPHKTVTLSDDLSFATYLEQQRSATPPPATRSIHAKFVVNCAGLFADKVANMIGDNSFKILPRIGEYLLLHKDQGKLIKSVLFPVPHRVMGKGIVVQPTLWGNLLLGPTARNLSDANKSSVQDVILELISKSRLLLPKFDATHVLFSYHLHFCHSFANNNTTYNSNNSDEKVIHSFAGARAKSDRGDWIIEPSAKAKRFIHVAGIDSPGLAGSPAIALAVIDLLKRTGLELSASATFDPYRAPIVKPKSGWNNLKVVNSIDDSVAPEKAVVCRCEKVTRAEIVDACHRSLPCDSTQAVRKRTRAGMGHCQGNFCEENVRRVIAIEHDVPEDAIARRPWPETSLLPQRWLTDAEKASYGQILK